MQLQFNLLKSCLLFLLLFSSSKVYTFAPSTIGDFVWYDSNNNGIQDAGEPQLNGVRVFLYEQTN
ncbi:MAG TPA: SdrD B-like domain-containing protein, partial [Saprospiraceae bacterium]|nr:SdrD B-like domain-containing protein [Saprospiraceae bacterium]